MPVYNYYYYYCNYRLKIVFITFPPQIKGKYHYVNIIIIDTGSGMLTNEIMHTNLNLHKYVYTYLVKGFYKFPTML